ncbi:MAG TPA: hypothetical protein VK563_04760 [Puia sp.]|nr:hypothetical protein [Puia sp.]
MRLSTRIAGILMAIASLAGCKKTGKPGGSGNTGSAYFFANTEWVGTCHTVSQEYDLPCYLRFNGDTTVSVYATFTWLVGGAIVWVDSTVGHITKIDTANGGTAISVTFPQSGDQQVYSISNKNELAGGSIASSPAPTNSTFNPHLQLCPKTIPNLSGDTWSSKKMTGGGPTDGMYAYPDVQTFSFGDNSKLVFYRGGKIVTYTPTDQIQILLFGYQQVGRLIYFAGFNETTDLLIPYFGVLAADGKTILVDARRKDVARLPNYVQTIYWYGPPGVTPAIYMQ